MESGPQFKHLDADYQNATVFSYRDPSRPGEAAFVSVSHPNTRVDLRHDWDGDWNDHHWTEPNGQMYLSEVHHYPAVVDGLAATAGARHAVPTLLGLAANHSLRTRGKLPEPDADLSSDSAHLVSKLVARGVVDPPKTNPSLEPQNDLGVKGTGQHVAERSWFRNNMYVADMGDRVPDTEVHQASKFIRSALRKPQSRSQNFEQGKLF